MRIALISDIHANAMALRSLVDELEAADRVVCLGDFVGYHCQVNEAIDLIRQFDPLCVLGNHDHFMLSGKQEKLPESVSFGVDHANTVITSKNRSWLESLPQTWTGELDGMTFFLCHGSPWRPMEDYLYADSELLSRLDEFEQDVIAFGQTHRQYSRLDRKPMLINPGSVGQTRDSDALGKAQAVVLDTQSHEIRFVARTYDFQSVLDDAVSHGAGDWIKKFAPQITGQ